MPGTAEVLVSDVKMVQRDPNTGVLTIGISRPPEFVSGIDKLVQIVVLELLASPGRDINDPNAGSNLRSLIGANVAFDDEAEVYAEIKLMIKTAETNIKERQENTSRPSNEKLSKLDLLDIVPDEENSQLEIILRVVSLDQQDTQAIVGLK
jgi:phage baseplate assembly protein W